MAFDRSGASAVEFALILPVLLLLLFGILAYGLYIGTAHSVAQLAADGARSAVGGLTSGERDSLSRSYIAQVAPDFELVHPDQVTVSTRQTGEAFRVTVRYDSSALPIWNFGLGLVLPSKIIERSATVLVGAS